MKVIGCQPNAPAAFTPRIILVLIFLEAASTPGHVELSDATEKTPATPGIDPGTFRVVAECLNHYTTPNRNEYQEYFLRGKGGRCVRLTTLPPSCADCLEIGEPETPVTLRACPGL